ncbi:MAG: hypothetical protein P8Y61_02710 [Gammaproteobacteria bacterium]
MRTRYLFRLEKFSSMFLLGVGLFCASHAACAADAEQAAADDFTPRLQEWGEEAPMVPGQDTVGPPQSLAKESRLSSETEQSLEPQTTESDIESDAELDFSAGPPTELAARVDPCEQFDGTEEHWLDQQQVFVYRTVCGATAWFDGFFGNRRYDQATGNTYGRITVGGYWDERDGWDQTLRFRARFALPALRRRGALTVGRGDEQDLIEERDTSGTGPASTARNTGQDDSTFVGFNFDKLRRLSKSFGLSVGVKLRAPPEPYVKLRYQRAWQISDRNLLRLRPVAYWRSEEGFGSTLAVDLDRVISNSLLFRWSNFGNISEDETVEGVDWGSTFYLYQALSNKRALTYSLFARGETKADVTFQNVGFEVRYRKRIFRDWLFVETGGGWSWPRYELDETREANFGLGLRFEAYFGPAPDDWMLQRF